MEKLLDKIKSKYVVLRDKVIIGLTSKMSKNKNITFVVLLLLVLFLLGIMTEIGVDKIEPND